MAAQTLLSIGEYLETSYRPDREYIDGEVRERNVGKWEHARVQALLASWFVSNEAAWKVMVSTEQRTQVASLRIRIPDLVLVHREQQPDVLMAPPVLVVEVLSPDDTYADTQNRAADYQRMGVATVWIVDPHTRTGRMCIGSTWTEAARLEVPGTPIHVELAEIFAQINPLAHP